MKRKKSIIIGGSKGNGLEILKELKMRGDYVINVSRGKNNKAHKNITLDLLDKKFLNILMSKLGKTKIDCLIFSQRYRGKKFEEEMQVMVNSCKDIINKLRNNLSEYSSVVFLSTVAIKSIADQEANYYIAQSSRDILAKYFAIKFNKNRVRFNSILPTKMIKKENNNFFNKNKKKKNLLIKINPLKKIPTSKDTAKLVGFLTSNDSRMINGESIKIDGGLNLYGQEELLTNFK
tara:strand:- start:319 stop:1020 length:702 start_codon:yes stop_codon:yes gene_type:complete